MTTYSFVRRFPLLFCLAAVPLASTPSAAASMTEVPIDSNRWHVEAEESRIEQHLGRTSLYLKDGMAWVEDSRFTDGVLEFDIAFSGERGFMGVMWRLQDADNYEEFYVRPHMSGHPDANQYTPAFDGLTSWQLYYGPGYGAPVEYRYEEWNTIRVVVSGDQAEVYVNDMDHPVLFIPDQKRVIRPGRVGLNAFFAPAHYSSFRYQPGDPPAFKGTPPDLPQAPEGAIMTWEVSDTFEWEKLSGRIDLPAEVMEARTWKSLSSEPSGTANIGQINSRGKNLTASLARLTITSDRERTIPVRFGYSDLVRVYLDGRVMYAGDNRYQSRDYRYLGTIGYFDEVFVPLRKGENQLCFAVAEAFGGWGIQALIERTEGIVIRP